MRAQDLIQDSVRENRIVTVDWSQDLEEALLVRCDDHAENGPIQEYWGTDDDGDAWRVHLEIRPTR